MYQSRPIGTEIWFHRVDSRIFPEGANSPLVFPKGGQPANQMGNGVFLKKKHCRPPLSSLKKTLPTRRQFNIAISSEMVTFLPGHSSSLKIMIHSNFFAVGQTRYSCSFRFLCARLHTCTLSLLYFCISFRKNETAILLKTKVEMPNSVSTNRNQVSPEDEIGGNQRN